MIKKYKIVAGRTMKQWNQDNDEIVRKHNHIPIRTKEEWTKHIKEYNKIRREYQKSFGGRPDGCNMSLLKISMDIFH